MRIIPWTQLLIGDSRPTLFTLLAVVGLVLLIACANVANLLLARSTSRTREIAVRAAMGATSWRLARQLITEGALLGLLGGLVSLPLAYAGVKGFVASKPIGLPKLFAIQIDANVLLFTFAISVLAGIIFGLAPALRGMRVSAGESLKQAGRSGSGGVRQNWTRSILVIAEVALSLVLLAGAGLLVRSFVRLLEVNPGFRPERIMTFALSFSGPKYKDMASSSGTRGAISPDAEAHQNSARRGRRGQLQRCSPYRPEHHQLPRQFLENLRCLQTSRYSWESTWFRPAISAPWELPFART